jgi:hypothetical protein
MNKRITLSTKTNKFPHGIYDNHKYGLVYIGLHDSEDDTWKVYLGWPSEEEIIKAKENGLEHVTLTVTYRSAQDGKITT